MDNRLYYKHGPIKRRTHNSYRRLLLSIVIYHCVGAPLILMLAAQFTGFSAFFRRQILGGAIEKYIKLLPRGEIGECLTSLLNKLHVWTERYTYEPHLLFFGSKQASKTTIKVTQVSEYALKDLLIVEVRHAPAKCLK